MGSTERPKNRCVPTQSLQLPKTIRIIITLSYVYNICNFISYFAEVEAGTCIDLWWSFDTVSMLARQKPCEFCHVSFDVSYHPIHRHYPPVPNLLRIPSERSYLHTDDVAIAERNREKHYWEMLFFLEPWKGSYTQFLIIICNPITLNYDKDFWILCCWAHKIECTSSAICSMVMMYQFTISWIMKINQPKQVETKRKTSKLSCFDHYSIIPI